jgi:Uri superfamily endonuclease
MSGDEPTRADAAGGPAVVLDPGAVAAGTDRLGVGAGDAPPGTYALVFGLDAAATIAVGALGAAEFAAGAYAYVGSAFGSNGLGRVDRHRRVADGAHGVRFWHVDYFGGHPAASLESIVAAPGSDVECRHTAAHRERAHGPGSGPDDADAAVPPGFGASDCGCPAHLVAGADAERLRAAAVDAVDAVTAVRG